jgi:DNA-binding SARP family transcriptional activator
MEFGMLGPFTVISDGRQLDLGGRKQRILLAMLACHGNQVRSVEQLVEELWDGRPPPTAVQNLRVYIYQLRRILGNERIKAWRSSGYELVIDHGELDTETFADLTTRGQGALSANLPVQAAEFLRTALKIWRGPALADLRDVGSLRSRAVWLDELRLSAIEAKNAAELALDLHASIVSDLLLLATEYPMRENIRAQLMIALYRSGRRAEALAAYREGRQILATELGVEPGPELHRLHQAILSDDDLQAEKVAVSRLPGSTEPAVSGPLAGELQQIRDMLLQLTYRLDRLEVNLRKGCQSPVAG